MTKVGKNKIEKKEEKTLVLFDAHAIIHRAYHALPDFSSSKGEPTGALYGLSSMLIKIITDLKPDYMAACLQAIRPHGKKPTMNLFCSSSALKTSSNLFQFLFTQSPVLKLMIS